MATLSAASRRNSAGSTNSARSSIKEDDPHRAEGTRSHLLSDRSDSGISDCSTASSRNAPSISAFANDCISEETEEPVSLKSISRAEPVKKPANKSSIEDKIRNLEIKASTPKQTKEIPEKTSRHEHLFAVDKNVRPTHIEGVPLSKANSHSASFQKTLAFWNR